MITSEKLAIYRKFNGDEDGWSHARCPGREIFEDGDWNAIQNLIQDLTILKRGFVTEEYGEQIRKRLSETAADKKVADALFEMA